MPQQGHNNDGVQKLRQVRDDASRLGDALAERIELRVAGVVEALRSAPPAVHGALADDIDATGRAMAQSAGKTGAAVNAVIDQEVKQLHDVLSNAELRAGEHGPSHSEVVISEEPATASPTSLGAEPRVKYSNDSGQLYAQSRRQLPPELVEYLVGLAQFPSRRANRVSILERGPGQGTFTAQMIDCLQQNDIRYTYIAEEPDSAMRTILNSRRLPNLFVTNRRAESVPEYGDKKFDLIVDCNVLYFLDQRRTNSNIYRLLQPNRGVYAGVLRYIGKQDFHDLWHLFAILPPYARGYPHPADMKNLGPFMEKLDPPFQEDKQAAASFAQKVSYTKREILHQLAPSSDRYLVAPPDIRIEMMTAIRDQLYRHPRFSGLGLDDPITFDYPAHVFLGQRYDDPDRPGTNIREYISTHPPESRGVPLHGRSPYELPPHMSHMRW